MKKDTRNSTKLAIRPDHPRRPIKIKLCMVGGLRRVVIHVKCDPNRSRGYGAVGVENGPFLLLWPVAYTTACNTVYVYIYTLCPKKNCGPELWRLTLSNLNRFQKFLHCCKEKEISNKPCVIIPTTP